MKLGINIDHVATIRNARGSTHPEIRRAAKMVLEAEADLITVHLREDRRHIRGADVIELINDNILPINLEMAATNEMVEFACTHKPATVCLVPEKREELTTEGGLDVIGNFANLHKSIEKMQKHDIKVFLFIDSNKEQVVASSKLKVEGIEIHTGSYADAISSARQEQLDKIKESVQLASSLNLECHAGHGLNYDNVKDIAAIENIVELNIGHFLIGEAIFIGLKEAIIRMKNIIG